MIAKDLSQLSEKLNIEKVDLLSFKSQYYQSWIPSAVHMLSRTAQGTTLDAVCEFLQIPQSLGRQAVATLQQMGLVTFAMNKIECLNSQVHLGADEDCIFQHHQNWRLKTIEKMNNGNHQGMHYSSVISCSRRDLEKVNKVLVEAIRQIRQTVKDSKDEEVAHYSIDFYNLSELRK